MLDTERCILCSRCTRFTDEVTKTHELGIFNRGDHSEIGTHADKPLNNNYSTNVIDICPVGALTSKDFRFRQRVWFLKDFETVCTGCSTGCNTKVYYNENGLYRIKPVYNKEVNGHWMCDVGRDIYKYLNLENRLTKAIHNDKTQDHVMAAGGATKRVGEALRAQVKADGADSVALVLTAQYTTEELQAMTEVFAKEFGSKNIFYWKNNPDGFEAFDDILYRGDHNPNTKGLEKVLKQYNVETNWNTLVQEVGSGKNQNGRRRRSRKSSGVSGFGDSGERAENRECHLVLCVSQRRVSEFPVANSHEVILGKRRHIYELQRH